jgi:hypothetical protein
LNVLNPQFDSTTPVEHSPVNSRFRILAVTDGISISSRVNLTRSIEGSLSLSDAVVFQIGAVQSDDFRRVLVAAEKGFAQLPPKSSRR